MLENCKCHSVIREARQISTTVTFHAIGRLGVFPIVEIFIRRCRELKTVGREMCGEREQEYEERKIGRSKKKRKNERKRFTTVK